MRRDGRRKRSRLTAMAVGLLGVLLCSSCSPADLLAFLDGCRNTDQTATGPAQSSQASFDRKHYRPPQATNGNPLVERATRWAEGIALDDSHGYSQARRDSQSDYDCSSLVWFAYKQAGIPLGDGWPFVTQTMGGILKANGFQEMTWSGSPRDTGMLQRGDVLVNPSEHIEIYAGGGLFVGARHACPTGTEDGKPGDQCTAATGDEEIGIEPAYRTSMTMVYRYTGGDRPTRNPDNAADGDQTAISTAWTCPDDDNDDARTTAYTGDAAHASPENAKSIARQQLQTSYKQWDNNEYQCLVWVWDHESGWRWNATNPSSGAYGIPQALPAGKLGEAGSDWHDNAGTQITWGLNYIKGRYGTPCEAQSFWKNHNWY